MTKFTVRDIILSCCINLTAFSFAQAQELAAIDDTIRTGPIQTVRKSIIHNDFIPGDTYSWKLVTFPPAAQGTAIVQGDYLIFTPAAGFHDTVRLQYELTGSGTTENASITVIVSEYNNPANIIDRDVECYSYMPADIPFGIQSKYQSSPRASDENWIDAMSSPLVGDLNGDGKPEIVMLGLHKATGTGALDAEGRYINIYNGQDGTRICRFDITSAETNYDRMDLTNSVPYFYHRAPISLALADLDGDGLGEIVMCHTETGRVAALKPVLNGAGKISGLSLMWEGKDNSGDIVSFKAPLSSTTKCVALFGMPHPYIADLNGDGIPEVIVYNKIYNGMTGKLLMAWQNAATAISPRTSSYISAGGLSDQNSSNPLNSAEAGNIRAKAMTGRRTRSGSYTDQPIAVPAIADIDGDGQQEIITGNRIHKFKFNSLSDHTQNTYYTIEGPQSVTVHESPSATVTYNLSDGFTRVADIDGDGKLDIIVETFGNASGDVNIYSKTVVFVWDTVSKSSVKACISFTSYNSYNTGGSIPFIGDINGKIDGYDGSEWTRKLPEICILGGGTYISRAPATDAASHGGRTGISIHPKASGLAGKFNTVPSGGKGHIIGLTWDDSAGSVEEKLKVSWGMEHRDASTVTGITLFDFDNNNAADLCYRDEWTLRVISPARSGKDYVPLNETVSPLSSVMFSADVFSGTGYEYPVIADVNMDGSADIVVTNIGSHSLDRTRGYFEVFEYSGHKWAPCPPVWNQSMYDPTQIREDLKINARPLSILTPFVKNGETIHPYNGSWIQQPIVRNKDSYVPVVRKPDAVLMNMKVSIAGNTATITLTVRNSGSASIGAQTPVTFYDGGTDGKTIADGIAKIGNPQHIGVDIFPDEKVTLTYQLSGNFVNHLIWARIMDDGVSFPAVHYDDCDISNNTFSGIDCPMLKYNVTAMPDTILCGKSGYVTLSAIPDNYTPVSPTYQWHRNDVAIPGANMQTHVATLAGEYKCYIIDNVCRGFSTAKTLTRKTPVPGNGNTGTCTIPLAVNDSVTVNAGDSITFDVRGNDYFGICEKDGLTAFDTIAGSRPKHGILTVNPADSSFRYAPAAGFTGVDSIAYYIKCGADSSAAKVYILVQKPLSLKYKACPGASLPIGFTAIPGNIVNYYWYSAETGGTAISAGNPANTLTIVKDSPGDIGTWWVEPRYGNIVFPRYRIDLETGDCEITDPQGCAKNGTVIWREDYGGNNPASPERSSTPLGTNIVDYTFCDAASGSMIQGENRYAIAKKTLAHTSPSIWHQGYGDHTHPGDLAKGYMFLANAGADAGKLYEYRIDSLCTGIDLYFSAWLSNWCTSEYTGTHDPYLKFELSTPDDIVQAVYYTGKLPRTSSSAGLTWLQYGFSFNPGTPSIIMRIYNSGTGDPGNDFVMDDIEIRLCTPKINTNIINSDTLICRRSSLDIIGTYADDCTFGNNLDYRWEFRHKDSISWKQIAAGSETLNCQAANPADRTIKETLSLTSATEYSEGYYRMTVSAAANTGSHCRAKSDSICVRILSPAKAPDIRIDVCHLPARQINLTAFTDTLEYTTVNWVNANHAGPVILNPHAGTINSAGLTGTFKYRYSLTSKCGTHSAMAYIHPLKNSFSRKIDTIIVCREQETNRYININRISGVELSGGTWSYPVNPDNTLSSNVTTFPASSNYHGAIVFNACKAWKEASNPAYATNYKGDTDAKRFVFRYSAADSCIGNFSRDIVIIVTEKMF
jgi:hypothetical protein